MAAVGKRALEVGWRNLLIGLVIPEHFVRTSALVGRPADTRSLIWLFAGGVAIGLALGPLARVMSATSKRHLAVWGSLVFFNIASVTIDGRFFVPARVQGSIGLPLLQQLAASLLGKPAPRRPSHATARA